ncbi:ABC transporter ATP-binding protein [Winogradskyella undariae]|uniref:ABC transporter ATP-binding protein n=1 Tax=Winogradskyella undariae TaxID=1285465 RepID=UPI0015CE406A|nr:ABC transporter ATP-binding protein [Winogradskyella undariae]
MKPAIKIENLSKQYRLGTVGTGSFAHDLNRWWHTVRGKEDPYLEIGEANDRANKGESDYVWALKDINFEVKPGEVLGIIGKNGAGKSTLLKLLSRVTRPTTGSIKARGRIASLLEVGTGFHPELTGRENVFLNGAIMGMNKQEIRSKFDEIVEFAGCERYIDTPVKRYSSGMYVRLAFAVAAHLEPEILIVDEVLAVGDAEFQKKAIGKMKEVAQGGKRTVLFVSHNMASIQNLCSTAVLMEKGTIIAQGDTKDIIDLYLQNNSGDFETHIADREDRTGTQNVVLEDYYIETKNGNKIDRVISGTDINIVFKLKCNSVKGNVDFGIALVNNNDFTLGIVYSSYQGKFFSVKEEDDHIYVKYEINHFPFSQGTYKIIARVLFNGIEADNLQGGIGQIDVEKGDFYGAGNYGEKGLGPVLLEGNWL